MLRLHQAGCDSLAQAAHRFPTNAYLANRYLLCRRLHGMRVNIALKNSSAPAGALYLLKIDAINRSEIFYGWAGR